LRETARMRGDLIFTLTSFLSPPNQENSINVILSAAKNLTFPPLTKARSFGYRLRMTLGHSL
jgi:hypothetical protein